MRYEKRDENRDIGFSTIRLRTLGARSWALRRTTALCLGNSGVEIACLRSAVLQTRHITVAGPRTVALQRAAPRRLRVEQLAWRSHLWLQDVPLR